MDIVHIHDLRAGKHLLQLVHNDGRENQAADKADSLCVGMLSLDLLEQLLEIQLAFGVVFEATNFADLRQNGNTALGQLVCVPGSSRRMPDRCRQLPDPLQG